MVEQVERIKTQLRDVISDLNDTVDLLKAAEKEKEGTTRRSSPSARPCAHSTRWSSARPQRRGVSVPPVSILTTEMWKHILNAADTAVDWIGDWLTDWTGYAAIPVRVDRRGVPVKSPSICRVTCS